MPGGEFSSSVIRTQGATGATGPTGPTGPTGAADLFPTGVTLDYWGTTAPTGWVLASGRTIGSATSGGTERANADTETLFTLLWESIANAELPIQDSAGAASSRGASAAADFAANKRLPLPDARGRVIAGKDNMGGTTASRMTSSGGIVGTTLGIAGGLETHTLIAAEMPVHSHGVTDPTHGHTLFYNDLSVSAGGSGTGGTSGTAYTSAAAATNISIQNAGSGSAHRNVQPAIIANKIIKL